MTPLALLACAEPAAAPVIQVVKSPYCGCCTYWLEHLRREGFEVRVSDIEDVTPFARRLGAAGCSRHDLLAGLEELDPMDSSSPDSLTYEA